MKIGILNGSDLTLSERGGGASGFISNILPKFSFNSTVFGIGYSHIQNWQEVSLHSTASFIPVANLKHISPRIPKRFPTLLFFLYHRKRILQSGVDLLYIHSPECAFPFVFFKSPIPVVFHQHGSANPVSIATFRWARNPFLIRILDEIHKIIYWRADWIIAIDKFCLEQARKNGAAHKVSLIMNSVDDSVFRPDELSRKQERDRYACRSDEFVLLFAGRLEEVKRVDKIIDSLACANNSFKMKLFIAGDGSLKKALEKRIREMNLTNRVFFLGYVAHDELPRLYNMADGFILPSIMEGTPMVVLEALACGTPVIATAVGGIPDLVENGKNGLLLDSPTPKDIFRAVLRLTGNPPDRSAIAGSVSRWRADNVAKELNALFSDLIKRNGSPASRSEELASRFMAGA